MEATRQDQAFALYRLAHNTDPEEFARLRAGTPTSIWGIVDAVILRGMPVERVYGGTPGDCRIAKECLKITVDAILERDRGRLA